MGKGSPSGNTTTTVVQAPPATNTALNGAVGKASGLYGDALGTLSSLKPVLGQAGDYYAKTMAGDTDATRTAKGLTDWTNPATSYYQTFLTSPTAAPARLASLADGIHNPAIDMLTRAASGAYLGGNPYNDRMFDKAAAKVRGQLADSFSAAGRYGSGAMAGSLASNLNDLATQIYGQDYGHERDLMQGAQTAIGSLSAGDVSQRMQALMESGNLSLSGMSGLSGTAADEARMRLSGAQLLGTLQGGAAGALPGLVGAGVTEANAGLQPIMAAAGTTSAQSTPYFTDPVAGGMAAGLGLLGAGQQAFGKNGLWPGALDGLFGSGAGAGSAAGMSDLAAGLDASGGSLTGLPLATVGDGSLEGMMGNFSIPGGVGSLGAEAGADTAFFDTLLSMFAV